MVEDILSGLKHYVFADTENDANNIPSFVAFLSEHKLFSKDSQIVCIIGADKSQKEYYEKLKKEVIKSANQKVVHITPIQITDVGTDALDKVLIAYVGMAVPKSQDAEFIIISSDGGYAPVVNRLHNIGVNIRLERLLANKSKSKQSQKSTNVKDESNSKQVKVNSRPKNLSEQMVEAICNKIAKTTQPTTFKALKNLVNQLKKKYNFEKDDLEHITMQVQSFLESSSKISVIDKKITWL